MIQQLITKREFLNLKSFMIVWYYFLRVFGINTLDGEDKKINYALLDKLQELPFSDKVKKELDFRIKLQKRYCTDANGDLLPLDRFVKETINFIVSKKDFDDFKLLNSIKDEQMDYNYMFIATAKHNEIKSMRYLKDRLISYKDDTLLQNALEYAIKSKSFDTTLELMKQKIKLDNSTQKYLLSLLYTQEYEQFYRKISGNNSIMLPLYSKKDVLKKRKMHKKTFSFLEHYADDRSFVYEYLSMIVHNSLLDMYNQNFIEDFNLNLISNQACVVTYARYYRVDFMKVFESILYKNGFNDWERDLLELADFENSEIKKGVYNIESIISNILSEEKIDIYNFINIDIE